MRCPGNGSSMEMCKFKSPPSGREIEGSCLFLLLHAYTMLLKAPFILAAATLVLSSEDIFEAVTRGVSPERTLLPGLFRCPIHLFLVPLQ